MRPREANKGPQSKSLTFRVFSDELKCIKAASSAANKSVSTFIRDSILSAVAPPIVLQLPANSETKNEKKMEQHKLKKDGRPRKREKLLLKNCAAHGIPKSQCFTCSNILADQ